jgi:hypothetical protein
VINSEKTAGRCYRLGLGAAKRRDLGAALDYASLACALDPGHDGAVRLTEICREELGGVGEAAPQGLVSLVRQKKWKAAAEEAKKLPRQSVWLLNVQGCLWALAKRYDSAAGCFAGALARDRGNRLAADALAELGRRRKFPWRFFCFSLAK